MKRIALFPALMVLAAAPVFAQNAEVAPGDNLVVDGVPKVPAALAETAGRYGNYRSAILADWHPERREMLVATRFGDTNQLHLVKAPGGARTQVTFFADAVSNGRFHPKGGDYIVFSKDVGGGEWFQLYRYDLASGRVALLTDGKSRNIRGPWSAGGHWIAYNSTRRTGKDSDLWVMNPADPKTDRMVGALEGGGWQPVDWSPDDKKILLLEGISVNESYLWLVDVASGQKTLLTPKGGKEKIAYGDGRFSKDGKGVYVATDKESEFQRLAYVELATLKHTYLTTQIPWDVEEFDLAADGKTIAFVTNENGASALRLLDTATGKEKAVPKLPVGVIENVRWHENGREAGFVLASARNPADCYSLDTATGKVERWTFSETEVHTDGFPEAELVEWESFDGKTISGFLYRPPAQFAGKRPVIINIHGGPEGQARPIFIGRNNYLLNELGVTILYPNVRGSTGYGKTFVKLDNGPQREDSYKDIAALLDWIATRPDLDASRVVVAGGSYGGHMTLAISAFYSDRIRCSVDVVGMSNLVTFLEHTEEYRRDLRRAEYGDERDPKTREFLEKIAPMNNIDKIRKPMFVVAGKNDPRVPASESQQIVAALKKNGTPVWYLEAKDEGHGFRKKKNQDFQFYAMVEFLEEYLLK